ncbi:nucleotide exchange factor GrpE [PVC group bacterium (ex Bugula neritina AB1)]|nr:nucleotide exchange factor GrpE [PVC group bacterium (ex Bugula neritina AB1)]
MSESEEKKQDDENLESIVDELIDDQEKIDCGDPSTVSKKGEDEKALDPLELNEKYLRLQADFDNFRKRTFKERSDLLKYGSENLILGLLDVLDNFDRAIQSSKNAQDISGVVQGIEMVQKQMKSVLDEKGLKKMKVQGETFDPHLHEALSYEENQEDFEDNIIMEEFQSGYKLHEKVIRFAKVKVAKKVNKDSKEGGE